MAETALPSCRAQAGGCQSWEALQEAGQGIALLLGRVWGGFGFSRHRKSPAAQ